MDRSIVTAAMIFAALVSCESPAPTPIVPLIPDTLELADFVGTYDLTHVDAQSLPAWSLEHPNGTRRDSVYQGVLTLRSDGRYVKVWDARGCVYSFIESRMICSERHTGIDSSTWVVARDSVIVNNYLRGTGSAGQVVLTFCTFMIAAPGASCPKSYSYNRRSPNTLAMVDVQGDYRLATISDDSLPTGRPLTASGVAQDTVFLGSLSLRPDARYVMRTERRVCRWDGITRTFACDPRETYVDSNSWSVSNDTIRLAVFSKAVRIAGDTIKFCNAVPSAPGSCLLHKYRRDH